uniref:prolyl aminopeptidase n=1 Tax=Calcidiscus leptoporus TaxID=127549 RepID=A0A7S0IS50_9EUKA|mmetsp:Transcript_20015/g.46183  ORF Transcript_20015/g.46183 Transcript_20015/m.46183 type:complete len:495 (+) Transcript_20015:113-1597(+)
MLHATLLSFSALYATSNTPLRSGCVPVGGVHSLYYEVHGKACGAPALFLHGGPGAGCFRRHAGFFDPTHYQIVLFDQRGCGRSTPKGCLEENDTVRLVEDCEALREHLGIKRWALVLGGSWGATLALAYAAAFPRRVRALVLRAVCLMRPREIAWLFGDMGGARRLLPAGWSSFEAVRAKHVALSQSPAEGEDPPSGNDEDAPPIEVLRWYARALATEGALRAEAAGGWLHWESAVFSECSRLPSLVDGGAEASVWGWRPAEARWLRGDGVELGADTVRQALCEGFEARVGAALASRPVQDKVAASVSAAAAGAIAKADRSTATGAQKGRRGAARHTQHDDNQRSSADASGARGPQGSAGDSGARSGWVPAQAMLTAHYSLHGAFMESNLGRVGTDDAADGCAHNGEPAFTLLKAVPRFRHIPCVAVHGGNDLICPPQTAYELHRAWPEMTLRVVHGAGHSMYDGGLQAEVIKATDSFRHLDHMTDVDSNFKSL